MQPPPTAPTASGAFEKTPFPHLLVYALERRLSGTFDLTVGTVTMARIVMAGGCPAKVRTAEPVHYLGELMLELEMISPEQLKASLDELQANPRLQGQILLELGAIDEATLEAGLRAQVERKIEHLFSLTSDTLFSYYDNVDLLADYGGAPTPIDPFPVLWRGVRESPAWEHVDASLRRVGNALLRASATAQSERFAFTEQERTVVEGLGERPTRILDITSRLGAHTGQVLIYFLMIMKQVELVDPAQPAPRAAPVPPPPPPPGPPQSVAPPNLSAPPSGQAFARVQLQRQAPRNPLVVEEVSAVTTADDRSSSPGIDRPRGAFSSEPQEASPEPPEADGLRTHTPVMPMNIGQMISNTIEHSQPPPAPDGQPPASTDAPLTAEQATLKTKILERADQITGQDYYKMLGVDQNATPEQIQAAFFQLAKVWHPDRLPPALLDVKDACSKVFTHLTEAHATLMDAAKRHDYMTLLREGGATPDDQAQIQKILEAATEFQKVEVLLKRNMNDPQAYEIVKRCVELDGTQADYVATLAWLDAQKPTFLSREKTLEQCSVLERCIQTNPNCERAYFYRGLLYKRIEESSKALKDFKKAADLNPRNLDAMREVRLHNMRGGATPKQQPGAGPKARPSKPPAAPGGLFGKLFKK
jgi:hypothetical protein